MESLHIFFYRQFYVVVSFFFYCGGRKLFFFVLASGGQKPSPIFVTVSSSSSLFSHHPLCAGTRAEKHSEALARQRVIIKTVHRLPQIGDKTTTSTITKQKQDLHAHR